MPINSTCITCRSLFTSEDISVRWCSIVCKILYYSDRSGGPDSCWNWTRGKNKGYGWLGSGDKNPTYAHRLMYEAVHNVSLPSKTVVRHKCDNRACVNPAHLEIGSRADNIQDMMDRGRNNQLKGGDHNKAKLTEEQALEIYHAREKASVTAERFGVSESTVWNIRTGKGWSHLTGGVPQKFKSGGKISCDQARDIYEDRASTGPELAKRYGISAALVSLIRNKKSHEHIHDD